MFADLAVHFLELRRSLERADRVLSAELPAPPSRLIYPPPAFEPAEVERQNAAMNDTLIAQPALATIEMGLHEQLARIGVRPDCVAGHSYGEFVALWAAGVLTADDLLRVSAARGAAIRNAQKVPGGMQSVSFEAASAIWCWLAPSTLQLRRRA